MTQSKRYLEFKHLDTGEVARQIDVTGKSEREIERIERGMLMNIGDDWFVNDTGLSGAQGEARASTGTPDEP